MESSRLTNTRTRAHTHTDTHQTHTHTRMDAHTHTDSGRMQTCRPLMARLCWVQLAVRPLRMPRAVWLFSSLTVQSPPFLSPCPHFCPPPPFNNPIHAGADVNIAEGPRILCAAPDDARGQPVAPPPHQRTQTSGTSKGGSKGGSQETSWVGGLLEKMRVRPRPLHAAAARGNAACIRVLLQHGTHALGVVHTYHIMSYQVCARAHTHTHTHTHTHLYVYMQVRMCLGVTHHTAPCSRGIDSREERQARVMSASVWGRDTRQSLRCGGVGTWHWFKKVRAMGEE